MKTMMTWMFALAFGLGSTLASAATKEEMVAFVKEAVAFSKANGKDKALKEFTDLKGKFQKGELYIYAYDWSGVNVAHGAKPQLVGKDLIKMKDKKGKFLIQELLNAAKKGGGFVEYYWENPTNKEVEHKLGYVEKVDDSYWLGSGIYLGKE